MCLSDSLRTFVCFPHLKAYCCAYLHKYTQFLTLHAPNLNSVCLVKGAYTWQKSSLVPVISYLIKSSWVGLYLISEISARADRLHNNSWDFKFEAVALTLFCIRTKLLFLNWIAMKLLSPVLYSTQKRILLLVVHEQKGSELDEYYLNLDTSP